jgi:hypothetical protein
MARGRMISTSIAFDPEFNRLTMPQQLLFLRTIPHLDRDGLISAIPTRLHGIVAPLVPELVGEIESAIKAWCDAGLVDVYTTPAGPILYFAGFSKNQPGMRYDQEAPSIFAAYMPDTFCEQTGMQQKPTTRKQRGNNVVTTLQSAPKDQREDQEEEERKKEHAHATDLSSSHSSENGTPTAPPPESPACDLSKERTDADLTRALVAKMESVGIGVTPMTVDTYVSAAMDYGIHAALSGITAAAEQGKQHRTSYVVACIRNKAQGIKPGAPPGNGNGSGSGGELDRDSVRAALRRARDARDHGIDPSFNDARLLEQAKAAGMNLKEM